MIPEPRSRLCFAVAALLALGAPFFPDLAEGGRRSPSWIATEGPGSLLAGLPFAALCLSGGWDPSRERNRPCLAVIGGALVGAWCLLGLTTLSDRGRPGWGFQAAAAILVSVASPVALFSAFMLTRELSSTAACGRVAAGIQGVAVSLPFWGEKEGTAWCLYGFAAAGALMVVGEMFEALAVKNDGRIIR